MACGFDGASVTGTREVIEHLERRVLSCWRGAITRLSRLVDIPGVGGISFGPYRRGVMFEKRATPSPAIWREFRAAALAGCVAAAARCRVGASAARYCADVSPLPMRASRSRRMVAKSA